MANMNGIITVNVSSVSSNALLVHKIADRLSRIDDVSEQVVFSVGGDASYTPYYILFKSSTLIDLPYILDCEEIHNCVTRIAGLDKSIRDASKYTINDIVRSFDLTLIYNSFDSSEIKFEYSKGVPIHNSKALSLVESSGFNMSDLNNLLYKVRKGLAPKHMLSSVAPNSTAISLHLDSLQDNNAVSNVLNLVRNHFISEGGLFI